MPVFDSIAAGYILFTPVDIWISQKDGQPWYEWPSLGPIQFHPVEQAPTHPDRNGHQTDYPKWINSWAVQTPAGYSTLFVQPFHRESVFTILPGVVDTDTQDRIDAVKSRLIKDYGYNDQSATDVLDYVSSIFARGDTAHDE
jgi:hypothetical protein